MQSMIFPIITEEEEKLPFYVTSTGANENQNHMKRPDGYPSYHLLYCTAGAGRLLMEGKAFKIAEGAGFCFRPGIPHEYYPVTEPWTTWWITFDGYAVKDLIKGIGFGEYNVFHISDMERLHRLHMGVHSEAALARPANVYGASVALYRFLLELKNCTGSESLKKSNGKNHQLKQLIQFMEDNYGKSISLNEMAEMAGVTPQHLCRLFRKHFNMRPMEYLTRLRLQKAKEILVGPEPVTLNEVAAMTGCNDTSYFCSLFRKYEGMTAAEFKRMHREF